ncbi:exonuclease [Naematelia encephala]|uniref:Exonuclease n=1 Tax=Naematelia encephala TaxID=71784 RepID=A0A1Y2AQA5_9TREE|nr:exonuclease [Naematelia encephala]
MFKSLGLFEPHPCPDPDCKRVRCIFTHRQPVVVRKVSDTPKRRESTVHEIVSPVKKLKAATAATVRDTPTASKVTARSPVKATGGGPSVTVPSQARPVPPSRPTNINSNSYTNAGAWSSTGVPKLPINLRNSPQPYADRQKGLTTLYTQYAKLYSKLPASSSQLAHDHTFAEEASVSASSPNLRAYKTAIHHAAVSISRRPIPDSLDHPSTGTIKASRAAHEKVQLEAASRLTRSSIEKYCLPLDQFSLWRYPDPNDPALLQSKGEIPSAEGETHTCSRCAMGFIVSAEKLQERLGECKFHHGRVAPERVEGKRKWIYSCCKKERGEVGCEDGVHVFSEKEDDVALGRRVAWKSSKALAEDRAIGGDVAKMSVDVLGMDCEMINTTAGLSLARVTIVDENGGVLLDELVRQTVPILDINTRFSGIKVGDLDKAIMDLNSVRAAASLFIGPETIIVGHGLENDLRALRLLHEKIIDTAIVFPHDKGPPFRRALRDIVKEKLGYFIQDRTADLGHSSAVDATCTLDILKWKVREDKQDASLM